MELDTATHEGGRCTDDVRRDHVNDVYNCALVGNNVWGTSMRRIQHEPSVESGSVFCAWRGDSGVLLLHA
jgi:hypothetical protein